eukprot:86907-Hanusia_phi.AAC.3
MSTCRGSKSSTSEMPIMKQLKKICEVNVMLLADEDAEAAAEKISALQEHFLLLSSTPPSFLSRTGLTGHATPSASCATLPDVLPSTSPGTPIGPPSCSQTSTATSGPTTRNGLPDRREPPAEPRDDWANAGTQDDWEGQPR